MATSGIESFQHTVAAVFSRISSGCQRKRASEPAPQSRDAVMKVEESVAQEPTSSPASTHSPSSDEASTSQDNGPDSTEAEDADSDEDQHTRKAQQSPSGTVKDSDADDTDEEVTAGDAEPAPTDAIASAGEKEPVRRRATEAELTSLGDCLMELIGMEDADEYVIKLVHRAIDLLFRCGFAVEDICCVLAHTSAYFMDAFEFCGPRMEAREVGNILLVLMFLAHTYILDETCPLRTWHSNLFRGYCTVKTLNAACLKLLEVRGYILSVEPDDLHRRHTKLMHAAGTVELQTPVQA